MSMVEGCLIVVCASSVEVTKPSARTAASSPSSRCTTWRVYRTSAATSEATNISLSPRPSTTGLPLRAATIRSGWRASRTTIP